MTLREELADLEHVQWSHWTSYMIGLLEPLLITEAQMKQDRDYVPSPRYMAAWEALNGWKRQIDTPYAELTEAEKVSDREWADKVLAVATPYATGLTPQDPSYIEMTPEEIATALGNE